MAKKKETKEKETAKKLVTPTKKAKEELDKLGVKTKETKNELGEMSDEAAKELEKLIGEADKHIDLRPEPIPEAKPEKLGTLVIDEGIERAEGKKEKLGMITTADLKTPPRIKRNKAHDAANDTIITTGDFKPRKWGESRKL